MPTCVVSLRLRRWAATTCAAIGLTLTLTPPAEAQNENLCDSAYQDCRALILEWIRNERIGLDVSYWFMTDTRYSNEIIRRWQAGVPVRILLDLRADQNYPAAATVRQSFINAGIPIRHKTTPGINHWKMILYAGQAKVHFSAANFANGSYSPIVPYTSYVDEAIYFTDDPTVVHSFMTKFDDLWTNTTHYQDLANVGALVRNYPAYPLDPNLNFPPDQDYQDRLVAQLRLETQQIDAAIFRITSSKVPDELIRRRQAGIPVHVITDQNQYRNPTYMWHSYNIDRMYMAGIPIKWKINHNDQDMHQKSVVLHGRNLVVFGSSNWTTSSSDSQREHNYFTSKPSLVAWFANQFYRKWHSLQADGQATSPQMFADYTPGWPEMPVNISPANSANGVGSTVTLRWEGGWWAHKYDVYLGASPDPTERIAIDYMPGAATAGVRASKESLAVSGLAPGTTYYWKIRGKTLLGDARAITGPIWSFSTGGGSSTSSGNVLADAYVRAGQYASTNFGRATELITKFSTDAQYHRRVFLKLDISDVQPSTSSVTLRLFGRLSDTRAASVRADIYPVADTTWSETGLTWNNQPALASSPYSYVVVSGTAARWYDVDLTTFVKGQRALGRTTATIALTYPFDALPYMTFGSKETSGRPQLLITP